MNIQQLLNDKIAQAMIAAGADKPCDAMVRQSSKPQFGDYQANGVMAAAKKLGKNPRQFAADALSFLDVSDMAAKVEIAGPGFINVFLRDDWLAKRIAKAASDDRLGVRGKTPQRVVVDYSAPNVAKEMHVGHLRSTIIGDSVARTLEFLGDTVIRANHVGDWGTQFGMLIAYLEKTQSDGADLALADLEDFYRKAKQMYDGDPDFAQKSRDYVVKLQSGDEYCLSMWQKLVQTTLAQCQKIYDRLNVSLRPEDTMGESLYNPTLPDVVKTLKQKGLADEDDGAIVVRLEEFKNKDGDPMGVIVQKKDGGYLYTTTDIAAAQYRNHTLNADRAIVFTDSRQSQHMAQAWTIARKAQLVDDDFVLDHFTFGMMLGKDGQPFKTRAGGTVKLSDLLDEAMDRAGVLIDQKNPDMPADQKADVVEAVAIGAVKYADLSKNRSTDYVFDWDNMLSFEGNTAPYIQYAYTRARSLLLRAKVSDADAQAFAPAINDDKERALALKLLQFEEALLVVAKDGAPHVLCQYLFDLAGVFASFYENCPILSADEPIKSGRLALTYLSAKTLKQGLDLLGIKTVEKM